MPSSSPPLSDSGDENSFTSGDTAKVSVAENAPGKYSNFFALAINEGEARALLHFAQNLCVPDVQFLFHVYSIKKATGKKPTNHFGQFTNGLLSLSQMMQFYSNFLLLVPDGFMEVLSSRCCYDRECTLYISTFRYTGSILCKDAQIADSDANGNIIGIREINPATITPDCRSFTCEGSLVLYRNRNGKFFKIEWFYEYV